MSKTLLVILGIVAAAFISVVVCAGIIGMAFYMTSGIVDTADSFFQQVSAGNIDEAWTHVSKEFKESTSREEFEAFLEQSSLDEYQSATWNNRQVTNNEGTLEGTIKTPDGSIPLTLTLVKGDDGWKIQAIELADSGIVNQSQASVPTLEESAALVKATTQEFALAVNNKDFTDFHKNLAVEFQDELSPEQFAEVFAVFIEQEIDLTVLEDLEPVFTADPGVAADGMLHLEGYFPSEPSRTHFSYNYVYRDDGWKLLGLDVNIKPIGKEGE